MAENVYTSGQYLEMNPSWHIEESPWKVQHILPMMRRHHLLPNTVCEVGCGFGEVLRLMQMRMSDACTFWGYDISPQAIKYLKGNCGTQDGRSRYTNVAIIITPMAISRKMELKRNLCSFFLMSAG